MSFGSFDASEASAADGPDGGLADLEVEVASGWDDELVQQSQQGSVLELMR